MALRIGNKVVLRNWIVEDLTEFRKWSTGHHSWMDLNGPYYPQLTLEELEQQLNAIQKIIRANSFRKDIKNLVIADSESNRFIGTVNWYWQSQETNWLSIGICLYDEEHWGKGIGFEAMGLWCDHLWEVFPEIARLDLRTWSGNTGMMKLAEKLGFQLEARFRKARVVNGKYYDSIGYGLLREEWRRGED